jgi:signal transduction histidine kinase
VNRRSVRATHLAVAAAAILVGLAAEAAALGWRSPERWMPDLVVGWTLIGAGMIGWTTRMGSRTGPLLMATGFAWFVPNFRGIDITPIAWLAAFGIRLHVGPLVHALMTFPTGRVDYGVERGVVAAGYLAATVPALTGSLVAQALLGVLLIGGAAWRTATAFGPTRRARGWAVPAATAIGFALIETAGRLVLPGRDSVTISLLAYHVALCGVAVWLTAGLRREPWKQAAVTDLVIEIGDGRSSPVRDALAAALGDPRLEVGYVIDGVAGYVDTRGRPLKDPVLDAGRVATPIEFDGRPVGVLVHDAAVLDDPGLLHSIAEAAGIAAVNARLQAEVRSQIADVDASRRRLVRAEDDERRRIQVALHEGTEARLRVVSASLAEAQRIARADAHETTLERATQAAGQLDGVLDDLRDLARGLHPAIIERLGLHAALVDLAERAPLPVEVDTSPVDLPLREASTAYYVCSEGIANVVKHARATRAVVRARVEGPNLLIEVIDDGVGGADPSGSGLRGLTDRVEALGGRLIVDSRPGTGTRLAAELRVDGEA